MLEGEGYFGLVPSRKNGKTYRYARVGLSMTDRDVVDRAGLLLRATPRRLEPGPGSKLPFFRLTIMGKRAIGIMEMLRPHLGERRRRQIDAVLSFELDRADPDEARRAWSTIAAGQRSRDSAGRFLEHTQPTDASG